MLQYRIYKDAKRLIDEINSNPDKYLIIHYSCESFVDREDGRTPRITSIAVRYFDSGQTRSFSIHKIAEQRKIPPANIEHNYDICEKEMLEQFFEFADKNQNCYWLHWNMRDENYGFYAIENRLKVLGGEPSSIRNQNKIDVARLFYSRYGQGYIGDPKLECLSRENNFTMKAFLTGAEEAKAFEDKNYIMLYQSTMRKVQLISEMIVSSGQNVLKTNAKWKLMYGVSIQGIYELVKERWWFALLTFSLGIVIGIIAGG